MKARTSAVSQITAVVIIVVIVAAAVGGGLYYYFFYAANSSSGSANTIRIGTTFGAADTSDVPSVYAMTVLMKQMGYTVNYVVFTGQQAAIAALLSGEVDVLQSSPVGPIAASQKNTSIIAFGAAESASDEIMVCTSNVTSMGQLATSHATVGVTSLTDSSYYYPYVWLSQHGYNPNNVNWVFVPGAAGRGAALLSGKIPCGATDVGSTVILLAQPGNKFHIVSTLASLIPTIPLNALFTTKSFLNSHQAALVALLEAGINANRWAHTKSNYIAFAPSVIGSQLNSTQLSSAYDILINIGIFNRDSPWNSTIGSTIAQIMGQFKLGGVTSTPDPSTWATYTLYQQAIAKTGS